MSREFRLVTRSGIVVLRTSSWKAATEGQGVCESSHPDKMCVLQQRRDGAWVTLTPKERMVLDVLHLDVLDGI